MTHLQPKREGILRFVVRTVDDRHGCAASITDATASDPAECSMFWLSTRLYTLHQALYLTLHHGLVEALKQGMADIRVHGYHEITIKQVRCSTAGCGMDGTDAFTLLALCKPTLSALQLFKVHNLDRHVDLLCEGDTA